MLTKYQLDCGIHGLHTKEYTESHHQITHLKKKNKIYQSTVQHTQWRFLWRQRKKSTQNFIQTTKQVTHIFSVIFSCFFCSF